MPIHAHERLAATEVDAMDESVRRQVSRKYCRRFGEIAIRLGFITEAQFLSAALECQRDDEWPERPYRPLGAILFEKDWMTGEEIDRVLDVLFRDDASGGRK